MALCRPGRAPLVTRGTCEGEFLRAYRGDGGFGYDPLFLSADFERTFAELTMEEKNAVSHRARAIQKLLEALEKDV
jgi:XTP/dITP diphosphohydrolase